MRDARIEKQPVKEKNRVIEYQEVIVDHGIEDKRLLLVEEELAQGLKVMSAGGKHSVRDYPAGVGWWES